MENTHCFPPMLLVAAIGICSASGDELVGPVPYLSFADVPAGFYADPSNVALEDFEDGTLDFGITANFGGVSIPGPRTDSVDADDGVIDGDGKAGHSWFGADEGNQASLTFTFAEPLPKAAGIVWTDGEQRHDIYFEAFGPGMISLGVLGPFGFADSFNTGQTGEDRFFGAKSADGILALRLTNIETVPFLGGLEVDHIQFEKPHVPKLNVTKTDSGIELSWTGIVGFQYQLEYDDDLFAPWTELAPIHTGDGNRVVIPIEPLPPLPVTKRFYRLRYWPSP